MPRRAAQHLWVDRKTYLINGLEPAYVFDSNLWYLGSRCKHGCSFPGTQNSLRRKYKVYGPMPKGAGRTVNQCACRYYGEDWLFKFLDLSSIGIDTTKRRLGELCKNSHDWQGTGKTLRRVNQNRCLDCEALRRQDPARKQQVAQLGKQWYEKNKNSHKACAKKNYLARKANNPVGEKLKRSINKHKRKALMNSAHTTKITSMDIKLHISARHQNACVYCNSRLNIVFDHFIPLAKGGPHVLGNLVPACQHCKSSKRDKDPMQWYFEQSFATQKGWSKILKLLNLTIKEDAAQLSLL